MKTVFTDTTEHQDHRASTEGEGARSDCHWGLQVAWPALHLGHAAPSRSQETHHDGRLLTCNSPCRRQLLRAFGGFGTEAGKEANERTRARREDAHEPGGGKTA